MNSDITITNFQNACMHGNLDQVKETVPVSASRCLLAHGFYVACNNGHANVAKYLRFMHDTHPMSQIPLVPPISLTVVCTACHKQNIPMIHWMISAYPTYVTPNILLFSIKYVPYNIVLEFVWNMIPTIVRNVIPPMVYCNPFENYPHLTADKRMNWIRLRIFMEYC
jgi:hypothetical protein